MAAIGDSITQAADVCCYYGDHPGQSWSTGGWWDPVRSHYERIRTANPAINGRAHNDAVDGAQMAAAPTQAAAAVAQGVDYVTILMGANDLCTSSPATMTPTSAFRDSFQAALQTLHDGLPNAHVFVSSIPDLYHLWQVLHGNWAAQAVWAYAGICPAMLSRANTEADRQLVAARETEFNQVLGDVCATYDNCRWDGGAVYRYPFTTSDVSTLDYFHPSISGQAALANVTWATSWWPN
jgi:lysophospholipase L1-like esterase